MELGTIINDNIIQKIFEFPDDKEYPFVIRKSRVFSLWNYSDNPNNVLIDKSSILSGDIVGHTHYLDSQAARFSVRDIITAKRFGHKILLYHTKTREFDYYDPNYSHPYPLLVNKNELSIKDFLGLRYEPIRCDCYSYTRDVAKAIYGLDLPNLFKQTTKYIDLKKIFTHPEKIGFKRVFNFSPGNFVLMNLSIETPFHMGILIGENTILHSLSEKHPTGILNLEGFKKNILGIYEHT